MSNSSGVTPPEDLVLHLTDHVFVLLAPEIPLANSQLFH